MRYEVIYLEQGDRRREIVEASDFSVTGSSQVTFYTRELVTGDNDNWGQPRRIRQQRQMAYFSGVVSVKPVVEEEHGIAFFDPEAFVPPVAPPPPLNPHHHTITGGPHP